MKICDNCSQPFTGFSYEIVDEHYKKIPFLIQCKKCLDENLEINKALRAKSRRLSPPLDVTRSPTRAKDWFQLLRPQDPKPFSYPFTAPSYAQYLISKQITMTEETKQKLIKQGRQDLVDAAEVIQTGYAGILSNGNIVDRRKIPYANTIPANPMFGIPEPKKLTYRTLPRLTKENLFNHLYEISNGAFQSFCDWIDEYKVRVKWDLYFSENFHSDMWGIPKGYPHFHEIPIAWQIGIMSEYFLDIGVKWEFFGDLEDLLSEIIDYWYQKGLKPDPLEYDRIENNGEVASDPAANG